jgi:SPW repeat
VITNIRRWQDKAILVLGAWLIASPLAIGFSSDIGARSLDFYFIGAVIALLAVYELWRRSMWGEWLLLILGAWMVGSPWLVGFASDRIAVVDSVAAGALVVLLSIWVILRYSPNPYEGARKR